MKMVSQLTRQALNRHLMLNSAYSSASAPAPTTGSFYPPSDQHNTPPRPPASIPAVRRASAPQAAPPQPRTIYKQLMSNHDRMTERHLRHT